MTHPIVVDQMRRQPRGPRRVSRREVLVEALRNTPLFSHATERDLRLVAKGATNRRVPAGKTIVREGEKGDRFYVVVDGAVRVTRGGRKVTDLRAGRGFGELSLLVNAPRTATVTTVVDTDLVSIDRKTFGRLLDESPAFARRMLQAVAKRLREHDAKAVQ
jgi:CRP/FNR family transcriptional regulator, cyclic AMP receptor protein